MKSPARWSAVRLRRASRQKARRFAAPDQIETESARAGEAAPPAESPAPSLDGEAAPRNAAAVLDRLPIGVVVARDARALYANRTLLDLVGYRDFAQFQAADGLASIFRGRAPEGAANPDSGAIAIVTADGRPLLVDGHAQAIAWNNEPATLIALRRSLEVRA